jgi:hypothetical protein
MSLSVRWSWVVWWGRGGGGRGCRRVSALQSAATAAVVLAAWLGGAVVAGEAERDAVGRQGPSA